LRQFSGRHGRERHSSTALAVARSAANLSFTGAISSLWSNGPELGYDATVVKDATASYSDEHMRAALEINIPNYASAIVTTDEIVDAIS
jgi:nicotinamidase-related amidase